MELGEQLAAKGQALPQTEPQVDYFSGEDPEKWNDLCQKRSDDCLAQKEKDRRRTSEAYEFLEGNPYDLTGSRTAETRFYIRWAKVLLQEIVGGIAENGFDIAIKADAPPSVNDPEYLQKLAQYAEAFGLDPNDTGKAASEMLTHGERTINERAHLDIMLQRMTEHALTDGTGAVYLYTGVSLFSPDVVVKEIVPAEQMWLDPNAPDFYHCEWFRRDWPITLERLKAKFPEHAEYFDAHKGAGKADSQKKSTGSTFDEDYVQEHWFRNWELVPGPDGVDAAKWPGHWVQVWRYGNKVLRIQPLRFMHEEIPYDQLLGLTKMRGPSGSSFVLDVLYGPIMAKNRSMNIALQTAEKQGAGKRLIDTGAVVNPEDLYDDSLSNIPVLPGYDLGQVVRDLVGPDISPSVKAILDIMSREVPQLVGATPPPGTVPPEASDAAHVGKVMAPFRQRLKDFLARSSKKSVSNLVQFDDRERAWQTMGGVGPPVFRFWAGIFRPIIENFDAYFSVEVTDKRANTTDPVKQAEITKIMQELALERAQNPMAPMPYSKALEMGPDFPDKDRMVRAARIAEAEQAKAEQEAQASGKPSPAQKAVAARNAVERGQGAVEVVKKAWQSIAQQNPIAVLNAVRTGAVENDFRIAQGEQPLQNPADLAAEVSASAGNGQGAPGMAPLQPGPEALGVQQ